MAMSEYLRSLRQRVGSDLILVPSVSVVMFDEGETRILLLREAGTNVWMTPGGSIEPGERPADAAVRETWEETGLLVEPVRLVGAFGGPEFEVIYPTGDRSAYVMSVFECRIVGGALEVDGEEVSEARYVAKEELTGLELRPWAHVVLPAVFSRERSAVFQEATWTP